MIPFELTASDLILKNHSNSCIEEDPIKTIYEFWYDEDWYSKMNHTLCFTYHMITTLNIHNNLCILTQWISSDSSPDTNTCTIIFHTSFFTLYHISCIHPTTHIHMHHAHHIFTFLFGNPYLAHTMLYLHYLKFTQRKL